MRENILLFLQRIYALLLRNAFSLYGSWPRMFELVYWPTIEVLAWGFITRYLGTAEIPSGSFIVATFIAGAVLMQIFMRSQFNVLVPFFDEMWSRNLGTIFVSPLRPLDYAVGLGCLSLLRTAIAMIPCVIVARFLFDFWLFDLGYAAIPFAINLALTGWWYGLLLIALLLRYGLAVEWLAWMATALTTPFMSVYYPNSVLPPLLQQLGWLLPPTYVFEMMRDIFNNRPVDDFMMLKALALNALYLCVSMWIFLRSYERTRNAGGLLQLSE